MLVSILSLLSFLHAADEKISKSEERLQQKSMERFACVHTDGFKQAALMVARVIVRPEIAKICCGWSGVRCDSGWVKRIEWKYSITLKKVDLRWAPQTVHIIELDRFAISQDFETRLLPRHLQHLTATSCELLGTPDMSQLPQGLCKMDVSDNGLSGTISLLHLPETLQIINFSRNQFENVLYDAASFPESLQAIRFSQAKEIQCYCPQKDKRVTFVPLEDDE